MAKKKQKSVAQSEKLLYIYSALNFVLVAFGLIYSIHTRPKPLVPSQTYSNSSLVAGDIVVLIIYLVVYSYLVTSKNVKRVLLILKIILAIQLLVLVIGVFVDGLLSLVALVLALFTYYMIRIISKSKNIVII